MLASCMELNSAMIGTAEVTSASQVGASRNSSVDILHAMFDRPGLHHTGI